MRRIITIGREFGSGGRELGRRLSEKLHIAYYDQEIISRQDCVQSFGVFRITVDRRDTVGIGVEILCMACK